MTIDRRKKETAKKIGIANAETNQKVWKRAKLRKVEATRGMADQDPAKRSRGAQKRRRTRLKTARTKTRMQGIWPTNLKTVRSAQIIDERNAIQSQGQKGIANPIMEMKAKSWLIAVFILLGL